MRDPLAPPVLDPDSNATAEQVVAKRKTKKRRRVRMGDAVGAAGSAAVVRATKPTALEDVGRRERAQKAKALLEGGRSKGEPKFGATAALVKKKG